MTVDQSVIDALTDKTPATPPQVAATPAATPSPALAELQAKAVAAEAALAAARAEAEAAKRATAELFKPVKDQAEGEARLRQAAKAAGVAEAELEAFLRESREPEPVKGDPLTEALKAKVEALERDLRGVTATSSDRFVSTVKERMAEALAEYGKTDTGVLGTLYARRKSLDGQEAADKAAEVFRKQIDQTAKKILNVKRQESNGTLDIGEIRTAYKMARSIVEESATTMVGDPSRLGVAQDVWAQQQAIRNAKPSTLEIKRSPDAKADLRRHITAVVQKSMADAIDGQTKL